MFLLVGLVTVVVGILVILPLPDNPMSSRLTKEEKYVAIERVGENQTGIENVHLKKHQIWERLKDPQTWLVSLIVTSFSIPNGAISSYQATITEGFGYISEQSALLQLPSGAVSIISIIFATHLAGRYNARGLNVITLILPGGVLGGALLAFPPKSNKAGTLIGNYLTQCVVASLPLNYSWVAANFAGHTEKVTMRAILLMSFCLGNVLGPLSLQDKDAPDYIPAKITILAVSVVACGFAGVLMGYYPWENGRRDRLHGGKEVRDLEFLDLTDRENAAFRYRL